ncbi:MAG: hypothetical protein A2383_02455 [Candidatus Pacebacteria bacterium RIFOXYB1_FULL_39_46]|nr:MAG: hypothetical protein A2383_02455 [Candidatus Pacebacteria bacterium RIFOXYB1_FULL_39_46]
MKEKKKAPPATHERNFPDSSSEMEHAKTVSVVGFKSSLEEKMRLLANLMIDKMLKDSENGTLKF